MKEFQLTRLPVSAKVLITLFLTAVAASHVFSLLLSYHVTHEAFASTEEYFHYQQDTRKLLRMSHQHAFGHGIMYLMLGGILCLSRIKENWKLFLIPLPFLGAGLDQTSWWLLKFRGVEWEILSYIGGGLFSFGVAAISLIILYELWFAKPLPTS
ncbi:MAG: hypothetical protein HYY63_05520 [Elusimicrobia bacterium]|nr:hypothetical protein [Elusimicrobiota bacterium]